MEADKFFDNFLVRDSLESTEWLGEVVDATDPNKVGRCRVRVYGKFDGRVDPDDDSSAYVIPDDQLPWAYPTGSSFFAGGGQGAGSLSVPRKGAKVKVRFSGGNIYAPEWYSIQDLNEKLASEINGSYENAHVILLDEDEQLKITYTQLKGLEIFLKGSHVLINPDSSITIENSNSDVITVGTSGISIMSKRSVDIHAGTNSISLDDSGINIEAGDESVFINGSNQVLFALAPGATKIMDVSEIGVSNSVKVGS